jgi:hypothetical protein
MLEKMLNTDPDVYSEKIESWTYTILSVFIFSVIIISSLLVKDESKIVHCVHVLIQLPKTK